MLVDLLQELEIFIFNCAGFANNGVVVVSTPQAVLADAKKGVSMFLSEAINVPVLGIIENMAYFTRQKNYLTISITFWKRRSENLAEDLGVPF
jgi:ATP-binding protein involved in chromosome partitioning